MDLPQRPPLRLSPSTAKATCREAAPKKPCATTPTHVFKYRLTSDQHMRQDHDAALDCIAGALRHLPALSNRGSHKFRHEQCLSKCDVIVEGRLWVSLDTEYRCRLEKRKQDRSRFRWSVRTFGARLLRRCLVPGPRGQVGRPMAPRKAPHEIYLTPHLISGRRT